MRRLARLSAVILLFALVYMVAGCGPTANEPQGTWEERGNNAVRTTHVNVGAAQSAVTDVEIGFGAADFRLTAASMLRLITGTVGYRDDRLRPDVESGSGFARIKQHANITGPDNLKSDWDLQLSTRYPMSLAVTAGAFAGDFDLSGLRLQNLRMKTGAAQCKVHFTRQNPERLDEMNITTGASSFEMDGLLNANFGYMRFEGGAGSYRLNFSGRLRKPAEVDIRTGVCSLAIEVPRDVPARIVVRGALTSISQGSFVVAATREFVNSAYRAGRPALEMTIEMGVGSVNLIEVQ